MALALIVLLPLLGATLPPLALRAGRNACALAAAAVTLAALVLLLTQVPAVAAGAAPQVQFQWLPALGVQAALRLDGLGLFFAALILGMGLLIIAYARFYLGPEDPPGRFYAWLLLFQGAMTGVALADDVLFLLVFWELTSLSSFLLIGYWNRLPESRQGARMALVVTGAGGLSLLAGMLLLGEIAGSYQLSAILREREAIQASPHYLPALLLILGGAFTKSAQFPFHFWLPHAMAAPTPVSAYLHSATMVKAGIFLLARLWPVLAGTPAWFWLVATTGLATLLIGAVIALFKDDLKALLAYSTVSHLGLVTMLLGLGTPAAAFAGLLHILNHSVFKAALFMSAGIVDHAAGTRDARRLGALATLMPITATLATLAAASMAGVPLLGGALSKELMLEAALGAPWVGMPVLVALAAAFSVAYALRYVVHVFFGARGADCPRTPHDPPAGMWLPPALLAAATVAIGLFPAALAGPPVALAARAVLGGVPEGIELAPWHGLTPAFALSVAVLAAGALMLWRYRGLHRAWKALPHPQAKAMYEAALVGLSMLCRGLVHGLHNGSLQRYLAIMLAAIVALGYLGFLLAAHGPGLRPALPATLPAVIAWLLLASACAALLALHRRRLHALIIVGVIGLIVAVAFMHFSAPDLAITQISVEVVTIVLMLLALNLLPKRTPVESPPARRWRDGALAALAGLGTGGAAWALMTREADSLSDYYLAQAVPGGGGANVVNVILVDFRGYDTFGEIVVLGIAALIIYALLEGALRGETGRRLAAWVPDQRRARDRHPMMLVVATRLILPLALLTGAYLFLRGHNAPGGGFVAGLVVAVALIMQYMASGFGWAEQQLRLDYHALLATGVLTAAATALAPWLLGYPLLTSAHGHLHLPLLGELELASAIAFDAGVFITVLGAVMLALADLSRVARCAGHESINVEPMDVDPSARWRHTVESN